MIGLYVKDHRTAEEKARDLAEFRKSPMGKRAEFCARRIDQLIIKAAVGD